MAEFVKLASRRRLAELDLDVPRFIAWAEVAFSLVRLGRTYEPSGTVEEMTVFHTSPPGFVPAGYREATRESPVAERIKRWDDFAQRPRYIDVPAEHHSILGQHVGLFQDLLRRELGVSPE